MSNEKIGNIFEDKFEKQLLEELKELETADLGENDVSIELITHLPLGDKVGDGTIIGYMCKIDFDYELGYGDGGSSVYNSVEDLKHCHPCADECEIVEVEVRLRRVVQPETQRSIDGPTGCD